eukprot:scaffold1397_cov254-Pinguiococcus_pyrenoidosus.AAC.46
MIETPKRLPPYYAPPDGFFGWRRRSDLRCRCPEQVPPASACANLESGGLLTQRKPNPRPGSGSAASPRRRRTLISVWSWTTSSTSWTATPPLVTMAPPRPSPDGARRQGARAWPIASTTSAGATSQSRLRARWKPASDRPRSSSISSWRPKRGRGRPMRASLRGFRCREIRPWWWRPRSLRPDSTRRTRKASRVLRSRNSSSLSTTLERASGDRPAS